MISQELFDETLLENEDVFELSPEDALQETIEQFEKSNQSVQHLSLTHPLSGQGKTERCEQQAFTAELNRLDQCVKEDGSVEIIEGTVETLTRIQEACLSKTFLAMLERQEGLYTLLSLLNVVVEEEDLQDTTKVSVLSSTLQCLIIILSKASTTQRDLTQAVLKKPLLQLRWSMDDGLTISVFQLLQACCRNNEANKKAWTAPRDSLRRLVAVLKATNNQDLAQSWCSFLTVLCRFDDFRESTGAPTIASSHDTVLELSRCGLVLVLKDWTDKAADNEILMPALLTTLRVMAVHDDIVQSMVAVGLLDTAMHILASSQGEELSTATIGMLRNVSANDEIKSTLCQSSVLLSIAQIADKYPDQALLQEHVCGLLGAMALRKPRNASRILQHDGARIVLAAMKRHDSNTVLQRQGALAIRNIAARATPEEKQLILDTLDAETLLQFAGLHGGSVDEAYAALRDLGCKVSKTTYHQDGSVSTKPQMFGEVQSNFRAVYD
jgi:hypothetical protein